MRENKVRELYANTPVNVIYPPAKRRQRARVLQRAIPLSSSLGRDMTGVNIR